MRAIQISLRASGSAALKSRGAPMVSRLRAGGNLVDAFETLGIFEKPTLGTIAIGERTGRLDSSLEQLAKDNQDTAARGMKLLILAAIGLVAACALVLIVHAMMGSLFGPIYDYYHLPDQIQ
jgi:type II secretory pathway component PulF